MSRQLAAKPNSDRRLTYEPMILATVCFAAGIFVDRKLDLAPLLIAALGAVAWLTWLTLTYRLPRRQQLACVFLYAMIFSSGAFWHHARWNWFAHDDIGSFSASGLESSTLRGTITSEPVRVAGRPASPTLDTFKAQDRVRFHVEVNSIRDGNQWREASGVARASVLLSEEQTRDEVPVQLPPCGAEIEMTGTIIGGSPTRNPGQFDFRKHFRGRGELATVFLDSSEAILPIAKSNNKKPSRRAALRGWIDQQLHQQLPPRQASFASAILLGNRDQMEYQVRQRFLKTGASHLLAISGLHVGILASGFLLLLKLGILRRKTCLYLTILFVLSYAWLVEFRPTVLRAAVLICVMCGARLLGRSALSWGSLATALLLVLVCNPNDLFSLGAQLSFLAISTTIIGKPWIFKAPAADPLKRLILQTRPTPVRMIDQFGRALRSAFCLSFLIWIVGLPLVASQFHSLALIAPLINPLLILPLTISLYAAIVLLILSALFPSSASAAALVCGLSLASIEGMIEFGSEQTFAHCWVAGPSAFSVAIFYLGIFLFAVFPHTRLPARWCILLGFTWLAFGWLLPARIASMDQHNGEELLLTVIDVKHGSAALVQLPDGKNLLFDCGSLSGSYWTATTISQTLWQHGVTKLDAVVVSHADVDHFNALPALLERLPVGSVWTSAAMIDSDAGSVQTFRDAIEEHSVDLVVVGAGQGMDLGDSSLEPSIEFLGPPAIPAGAIAGKIGDNEMSLVASLRWQGRHILLPGDVEGIGLEFLLKSPVEKVDVLVAAHHGSKHSDPQRFARWCRPEQIIASCGANRFSEHEVQQFQQGHPCQVLSTDRHGAVRCVIDENGGLSVTRWDGERWAAP